MLVARRQQQLMEVRVRQQLVVVAVRRRMRQQLVVGVRRMEQQLVVARRRARQQLHGLHGRGGEEDDAAAGGGDEEEGVAAAGSEEEREETASTGLVKAPLTSLWPERVGLGELAAEVSGAQTRLVTRVGQKRRSATFTYEFGHQCWPREGAAHQGGSRSGRIWRRGSGCREGHDMRG